MTPVRWLRYTYGMGSRTPPGLWRATAIRLTREQGDFDHRELAAALPATGYPRYQFAREWIRRTKREGDLLEQTATSQRARPARHRVRATHLT